MNKDFADPDYSRNMSVTILFIAIGRPDFVVRRYRASISSWICRRAHAGAEALNPPTADYYIVVEVTASPVERTHWSMVYGSKALGEEKRPL
jgi:hypothetical protein